MFGKSRSMWLNTLLTISTTEVTENLIFPLSLVLNFNLLNQVNHF